METSHHPNKGKKQFPAQSNTISKKEAILRTANWRQQVASLFPPDEFTGPGGLEEAIPKCMHINISDILQIVNDYSLLGYTISGIRLYYTLENKNAERKFHVTGILVPTVQPPDGIEGEQHDLFIPIPVMDEAGATSTGQSVYDFTRPCPTYCTGTTQELTGGQTQR